MVAVMERRQMSKAEFWTIVTLGVAILASTNIQLFNLNSRVFDNSQTIADIRAEMAEGFASINVDFADFKAELGNGFANFRSEIVGEFTDFRSEVVREVAKIRVEQAEQKSAHEIAISDLDLQIDRIRSGP